MRIPLISIALIAAPAVHAGVIPFSARTAFERAAGPTVHEDFHRCVRHTTAFTGPLERGNANAACSAEAIVPGLQLSDDGGPGSRALYLAAPHYAGNREFSVGQNGAASDALDLAFTTPTRAAGFDLFQNFGGGAQLGHAAAFDVGVWSGDTLLGQYIVEVPSARGAFFGVIAPDAPITRIAVNNPQAYDLVGNITLAGSVPRFAALAAPATEPGEFALLALGAGVIAVARRR